MRIMTCVLNENLHGQRVDRSSKFHPEQFLHQDHWITTKSKEHDKDIWYIVSLSFEPLAMPLYCLMDLFEGQ